MRTAFSQIALLILARYTMDMTERSDIIDNPELLARLEAEAKRTSRSREEVIEAAVQGYLDWHEDCVARVERGQAAAERGEFASAEDVARVLGKYRPL